MWRSFFEMLLEVVLSLSHRMNAFDFAKPTRKVPIVSNVIQYKLERGAISDDCKNIDSVVYTISG
jgi:hypothetical protein